MTKAMDPRWREVSWRQALSHATPAVARLLEKSLEGRELDFDGGLALATVKGSDLLALVKVADEMRRQKVGDRITYVVNRNLNFTNICIVGCAFCGFSRGPKAKDAYFHSTETLLAKTREALALGATEVCIQGGLPRDLNGNYYAELLGAIHSQLPHLHLHAYSPMEISYGVEKTGLSLRDYLIRLKEVGLGSIPGTAAEILDDDVRGDLSPNKLKVSRWIDVITLIVHALARILLNDHIPNLQVSWVKLGFDGALACLEAGANDFSGTLMEESISKAAGADFGESVLPGELRAMIRSIGRVPAERDTAYGIRRVFAEADADERLPVERLAARHAPIGVGY